MGFPVFPNICAGLLPTIIINIVVFLASMKHTLIVFLKVLGFTGQPSSTQYDTNNIVFPDEYEPSTGLAFLGFSDEVVQALPLMIYNPDSMNLCMDMECAVCLSEFERGQEIRLLPACKHAYHRHCLDKWLDHQRTTCPLCRASLVPEDLAKRQQIKDQQLSEDIVFWFSSFPGAGFPSFWCYT